jgi:hypothetical protein
MDFWIYLNSNSENVDLALRITFLKSNLRLEALIFKDLGEREEKDPKKNELIPSLINFNTSLYEHINGLSGHACKELQS